MTPLRRAGIAIVLLTLALLASMALKQLLAVAPMAARRDATRADVLAVAREAGDAEPFEKEGYTWIDSIGLRFDAAGRLIEVRPAWD